jgi:hypothetical protein
MWFAPRDLEATAAHARAVQEDCLAKQERERSTIDTIAVHITGSSCCQCFVLCALASVNNDGGSRADDGIDRTIERSNARHAAGVCSVRATRTCLG